MMGTPRWWKTQWALMATMTTLGPYREFFVYCSRRR